MSKGKTYTGWVPCTGKPSVPIMDDNGMPKTYKSKSKALKAATRAANSIGFVTEDSSVVRVRLRLRK